MGRYGDVLSTAFMSCALNLACLIFVSRFELSTSQHRLPDGRLQLISGLGHGGQPTWNHNGYAKFSYANSAGSLTQNVPSYRRVRWAQISRPQRSYSSSQRSYSNRGTSQSQVNAHGDASTRNGQPQRRYRRQAGTSHQHMTWNFHPDNQKPNTAPGSIKTNNKNTPMDIVDSAGNTAGLTKQGIVQLPPPQAVTETFYQVGPLGQPSFLSKASFTSVTGPTNTGPRRGTKSPIVNRNVEKPNVQREPFVNGPTQSIIDNFFPQMQRLIGQVSKGKPNTFMDNSGPSRLTSSSNLQSSSGSRAENLDSSANNVISNTNLHAPSSNINSNKMISSGKSRTLQTGENALISNRNVQPLSKTGTITIGQLSKENPLPPNNLAGNSLIQTTSKGKTPMLPLQSTEQVQGQVADRPIEQQFHHPHHRMPGGRQVQVKPAVSKAAGKIIERMRLTGNHMSGFHPQSQVNMNKRLRNQETLFNQGLTHAHADHGLGAHNLNSIFNDQQTPNARNAAQQKSRGNAGQAFIPPNGQMSNKQSGHDTVAQVTPAASHAHLQSNPDISGQFIHTQNKTPLKRQIHLGKINVSKMPQNSIGRQKQVRTNQKNQNQMRKASQKQHMKKKSPVLGILPPKQQLDLIQASLPQGSPTVSQTQPNTGPLQPQQNSLSKLNSVSRLPNAGQGPQSMEFSSPLNTAIRHRNSGHGRRPQDFLNQVHTMSKQTSAGQSQQPKDFLNPVNTISKQPSAGQSQQQQDFLNPLNTAYRQPNANSILQSQDLLNPVNTISKQPSAGQSQQPPDILHSLNTVSRQPNANPIVQSQDFINPVNTISKQPSAGQSQQPSNFLQSLNTVSRQPNANQIVQPQGTLNPSNTLPVSELDIYQQIQGLTIKDLAKANFTRDQIINALTQNLKTNDLGPDRSKSVSSQTGQPPVAHIPKRQFQTPRGGGKLSLTTNNSQKQFRPLTNAGNNKRNLENILPITTDILMSTSEKRQSTLTPNGNLRQSHGSGASNNVILFNPMKNGPGESTSAGMDPVQPIGGFMDQSQPSQNRRNRIMSSQNAANLAEIQTTLNPNYNRANQFGAVSNGPNSLNLPVNSKNGLRHTNRRPDLRATQNQESGVQERLGYKTHAVVNSGRMNGFAPTERVKTVQPIVSNDRKQGNLHANPLERIKHPQILRRIDVQREQGQNRQANKQSKLTSKFPNSRTNQASTGQKINATPHNSLHNQLQVQKMDPNRPLNHLQNFEHGSLNTQESTTRKSNSQTSRGVLVKHLFFQDMAEFITPHSSLPTTTTTPSTARPTLQPSPKPEQIASRNGRRPSGKGRRRPQSRKRPNKVRRRPNRGRGRKVRKIPRKILPKISSSVDTLKTNNESISKQESKLKQRKLNITKETRIVTRPLGPSNIQTNALLSRIMQELKKTVTTPSPVNQDISSKLSQILALLQSSTQPANNLLSMGPTTPPVSMMQLLGVTPNLPQVPVGVGKNAAGQFGPMEMLMMSSMLQENRQEGGTPGFHSPFMAGLSGSNVPIGLNSTVLPGQSNMNSTLMQAFMQHMLTSNENNACGCYPKVVGCPNDLLPRRGGRGATCKKNEIRCCDDN